MKEHEFYPDESAYNPQEKTIEIIITTPNRVYKDLASRQKTIGNDFKKLSTEELWEHFS